MTNYKLVGYRADHRHFIAYLGARYAGNDVINLVAYAREDVYSENKYEPFTPS